MSVQIGQTFTRLVPPKNTLVDFEMKIPTNKKCIKKIASNI